jgi:hypothetical protein
LYVCNIPLRARLVADRLHKPAGRTQHDSKDAGTGLPRLTGDRAVGSDADAGDRMGRVIFRAHRWRAAERRDRLRNRTTGLS